MNFTFRWLDYYLNQQWIKENGTALGSCKNGKIWYNSRVVAPYTGNRRGVQNGFYHFYISFRRSRYYLSFYLQMARRKEQRQLAYIKTPELPLRGFCLVYHRFHYLFICHKYYIICVLLCQICNIKSINIVNF